MNQETIDELWHRFAKGNITEQEKEVLYQWIAENADTEQLAFYMEGSWSIFENPEVLSDNKASHILKEILKSKNNKAVKETVADGEFVAAGFKNRKYIIAAAAVLIIFITGMVIFLNTGIQKPPSLARQAISGPKRGAVFIKYDNTEVQLSDFNSRDEKILENDHADLAYNNGVLLYKGDIAGGSGRMNRLVVPRGSQYQLVLPDGTAVWLNAGSTLKFPAVFDDKQRQVILTGEAYFEVTSNARRPFIVTTNRQTVKVYGTKFNINAYPGVAEEKTTLLEGVVHVENNYTSETKKMVPGTEVKVSDTPLLTSMTNVQDVVSWKEKVFVFNSETFKNVMDIIARWYDVSFVVEDNSILQKSITGKINKEASLEEVLVMLQLVANINYTQSGRKIQIQSR